MFFLSSHLTMASFMAGDAVSFASWCSADLSIALLFAAAFLAIFVPSPFLGEAATFLATFLAALATVFAGLDSSRKVVSMASMSLLLQAVWYLLKASAHEVPALSMRVEHFLVP